jgi:hypothetical protein
MHTHFKEKWAPVSSTAYGANAVYIPEFGKPKTLELILVMVQNYPQFKTHPVLDVFHGYTKGIERFKENHEMRVLGWDIKPDKDQWSFLYLPTLDNSVRVFVTFSANCEGRLRMTMHMSNPSPIKRQWEFHLYISPCEGVELPGYHLKKIKSDECCFKLNDIEMKCQSENIIFNGIKETDSNLWINFPFNAELSEDSCNPCRRHKKRLKLTTQWIDINANEDSQAILDFYPKTEAEFSQKPEVFCNTPVSAKELPYQHAVWEALHNQQYTLSSNGSGLMTLKPIPARQWGKFFIWDTGLTAVGLADVDEKTVNHIISEMPDYRIIRDAVFGFGGYVITAVFALWELYRCTGNLDYVKAHYDHLKHLVMHAFDTLPGEDYDGMVATGLFGTGADDNPASFYANGELFAWDYQDTLPVNSEHRKKSLICIGMTAFALRKLKLLRIFAFLLEKEEDIFAYSDQIDSLEEKLNKDYWNDKYQCYLDRVVDEDHLLEIPWIYNYLPLFSGSVPDERKAIMLDELVREGGYFTKHGFTIVKPDSPYYRSKGYPNGAIWPPLQYFFWKACFCMGKITVAKQIAEKYFRVFENNHHDSLCCWEQFRVDTGAGAGNTRFSGFVTPIVAMYKAYHEYGVIQTGYDVLIINKRLDSKGCKLDLKVPFYSGETGLSIVLVPETEYYLFINGVRKSILISDCNGWLGFVLDVNEEDNLEINIVSSLLFTDE